MRAFNSSGKSALLVHDNKSDMLPTMGYIFACLIIIVGLTLGFRDAFFMVFAIPLSALIGIAALQDKGSINKNAETIGLGTDNIVKSIGLGFLGASLSLIFGTIVMGLNLMQASIFIPDFSAAASIVVGSVIPANLATMAEITSQWTVVAPSEEAGFRIVFPYAIETIIPSIPVMFGLSILVWAMYHYPTWVMSGTNPNMYLVIVVWGILWAGLLLLTNSFMSPVVAHGSTNTAVLLASANMVSFFTMIIVFAIIGGALYGFAQMSDG